MNEETINQLCEKFHTTMNNLIPMYSRYMITKDIISGFIVLVIIIICTIICWKIWRWMKSDNYDEYAIAPICVGIIAAVCGLICLIGCICTIYDLILWCSYPALRFLDTVLQIGG